VNSPFRPLIAIIRLQNPGMTLAQATDAFLLGGFPGLVGPLVRDPQFFTPVPAEQFATDRSHSFSRVQDLGSGYLKTWEVDGQIEYNFEGLPLLGDVDMFFVGGYGSIENEGISESDATTYGALDTKSAQVPETKRTLELRFQSNNDTWLNWTLGIFYVKNEIEQVRNTLTPLTISGASLTQVDTGYAPFANVTIKPIDPIEIFLGWRWNHDSFLRHEISNPTALTASTDFQMPRPKIWRETTLDAGLKWFIDDDRMVYVKWARGYKAGFIQLLPDPAGGATPNDPSDDFEIHNVQPEVIIAEEIGAKTGWFDGRVHANLSAFHYGYKNLQVPTIRVLQIVNSNAKKATVWGAELNVDTRPIEDLDVRVAVGWLKARFDTFCLDEPLEAFNPPPVDPACVGNVDGGTDLSGHTLEDSPSWKISALATYLFDLGNAGTIRPTLEFGWTDTAFRRPQNNPLVDRVPSYTKTSLRVRWEEPEHRYWLEAFGENLENNYIYPRGIVVALTGTAEGFGLLTPRTYGVRLGFNWGAH
jgi:iron complex outermembrane receptor protein